MKQTILAISGKPGLYKLVSRASNSLIVEALDETHKRMPAFGTDRITSLADIAMFTETEDVPLMKVLASMRDLEKGKESTHAFCVLQSIAWLWHCQTMPPPAHRGHKAKHLW